MPIEIAGYHKRTRAERKQARRDEWAKTEAQREAERREHPVLSGAVKFTNYVPPNGTYTVES